MKKYSIEPKMEFKLTLAGETTRVTADLVLSTIANQLLYDYVGDGLVDAEFIEGSLGLFYLVQEMKDESPFFFSNYTREQRQEALEEYERNIVWHYFDGDLRGHYEQLFAELKKI